MNFTFFLISYSYQHHIDYNHNSTWHPEREGGRNYRIRLIDSKDTPTGTVVQAVDFFSFCTRGVDSREDRDEREQSGDKPAEEDHHIATTFRRRAVMFEWTYNRQITIQGNASEMDDRRSGEENVARKPQATHELEEKANATISVLNRGSFASLFRDSLTMTVKVSIATEKEFFSQSISRRATLDWIRRYAQIARELQRELFLSLPRHRLTKQKSKKISSANLLPRISIFLELIVIRKRS